MARTGRPRVNKESRDIKLTFRFSQAEKDKIGKVAAKIGISRTNAVLKGIELLEQQFND